MAIWNVVARVCPPCPEPPRRSSRGWAPLRPTGPVLAAYVPDEGATAALIAEEPDVHFTTSHFDGYPAVLCRLDRLAGQALTELVAEAWACRAPKRLLAQLPSRGPG